VVSHTRSALSKPAPVAGRPRVLLIGHVSASHHGAATVSSAWPQATVDLLAYGRAPEDTPFPAGARRLKLPALSPRSLASFVGGLWRQRYDIAAVCQPRLEISRARGALLGLALASGARLIVTLGLESGGIRSIARTVALADLIRYAAFNAGARAAVPAVTLAVRVAAGLVPPRPAQDAPPVGGSVSYLRTDLDLALEPLQTGGSVAHTEGVLRALRRRPHEVELWMTGELAGMPAGIPRRPLPTLVKPNVPWELAELLSGFAQAVRLARNARPTSFVYQRYSLNNLAGVVLARTRRIPLVLEANASEVTWREEWSSLQFPQLARACEQFVMRSSDRIATVSDNAARDLLAAGVDPCRLRIVPNGVEVDRFRNAEARALPFAPDAIVVAFAGLFYPWHGARWLAEAFALVHRERSRARLLLVGDGEEAPLVRLILEREGVAHATAITGMVARDDVPAYLAAADILASPHARNDSFIGSPIKLWEYMASGRAIVASDVAQMGEVLRHGETALVVAPEDPQALAAAIVELIDDPQLRRRLGAAAAAEAAAQHSWDARLRSALSATS
jgi:glycosyltransferase involved in cell wall biosynthesis